MERRIIEANDGFSFRLYSQVIKERSRRNVVVSPLSVAAALAIAMNGASGKTRDAISSLLGVPDSEITELNDWYCEVLPALSKSNAVLSVNMANSLWLRDGVIFRKDYLDLISRCYGAEATSLNLENSTAIERINGWVARKTSGKVPHIVDETIIGSVFVIVNAVYFKGSWNNPFRVDMTREEPFTLSDGKQKTVPMMFQDGTYEYFENSGFQLLGLPYRKKDMNMYVLLPRTGKTLEEIHILLNHANWESWFSRIRQRPGRVGLPRFREEFKTRLDVTLKAMGMEIAFDHHRAEFTAMTSNSAMFAISTFNHHSFLEVNEQGTEAAAATEMSAKAEEPPTEEQFTMIVNRSFMFAIIDRASKSMLFLGSISDPN